MTSRVHIRGKVGIDESDSDGVTALQIAAAKGHQTTGELSCERGECFDRPGNNGWSR